MSEAGRRWSEVSDEKANAFRQAPQSRVAAPATAPIVVGCLGLVANLPVPFALHVLRKDRGPAERPAGMDDATYKSHELGRESAPVLDCCLVCVPTLAVYPLVIAAGTRLRHLQNRWFVTAGALLAMAPCSPVVVFGLPVGVWVLVVLADSSVRAGFQGAGPHR